LSCLSVRHVRDLVSKQLKYIIKLLSPSVIPVFSHENLDRVTLSGDDKYMRDTKNSMVFHKYLSKFNKKYVRTVGK